LATGVGVGPLGAIGGRGAIAGVGMFPKPSKELAHSFVWEAHTAGVDDFPAFLMLS
jgi:hypothetical protein